MKFLRKHYFALSIIVILTLAISLRFYDYDNRWGLAYDQAHDALIAHYAVENFKIPLLGPFSSAGPFQTGGEWYWIIMLGTIIYPGAVITPWLFMTSLYVGFVGLIIIVANKIAGRKYALIAGLLAAVSTAQIIQGTNLANQSPQALFSLLSILFAVLYVKKNSLRYLFWLGFFIGFAASIHLSGAGLVFIPLSVFIILRKFPIKGVLLLALGGIIPWLPIFWIDSQNNFINTQNMIQYYLHDQYKIPLEVLGRRWTTFLGNFIPEEWAYIIGGFPILGYIEIALIGSLFFFKKLVRKEILIVILSLVFMIILLRYTHTPIFRSYLVFIHPMVLLITSWTVYVLIVKKKVIGVFILLIIFSASMYTNIIEISKQSNRSNIFAKAQLTALDKRYKNDKFAVYSFNNFWNAQNYILALYLEKEGKIDPNGRRISIIRNADFKRPIILKDDIGHALIDVDASSAAILKKQNWKNIDAKGVYLETQE